VQVCTSGFKKDRREAILLLQMQGEKNEKRGCEGKGANFVVGKRGSVSRFPPKARQGKEERVALQVGGWRGGVGGKREPRESSEVY